MKHPSIVKSEVLDDFEHIITINKPCPDCRTIMQGSIKESAWTENEYFVVIPVWCPSCGFMACLSIDLRPKK